MKKFLKLLFLTGIISLSANQHLKAQEANPSNVIHITYLKMVWPENGSQRERDSLRSIFVKNVILKNDKIISHREMQHFFTADSKEFMMIDEYKSLEDIEAAFDKDDELIKAAWPDETKRKEFFDKMGKYFEDWHGDGLYLSNPTLKK